MIKMVKECLNNAFKRKMFFKAQILYVDEFAMITKNINDDTHRINLEKLEILAKDMK